MKFHGPAVIGTLDLRTARTVTGRAPAAWCLGADAQAFLVVQTIDPLGVDRPALPPKQHMQATIPVPDSGRRQLLEPQPQLVLRIGRGPVALGRTGEPGHPAHPAFAHLIGPPQPSHQAPAARGPHHFRRTTSCNIVLSKVRSATSVFRRRFSSSSCFNRRISATPSPANFFFQR